MALFGILNTSGSGLYVNRKWMDAVSDNISNMNDVTSPDKEAFQERLIVASANQYGQVGGGVQADAQFTQGRSRLVSDPQNPLAQDGMVKYPDIDLSQQMTNMIMAQRAYQANLAIIDRAREAYSAAITIGK